MTITANNSVEIPATPKQTYGNLRLSLLQIQWTNANAEMRVVAEIRRCKVDSDGTHTDMSRPQTIEPSRTSGPKARATKVIPNFMKYAADRANAGKPELQNALQALALEFCRIAEEDGDI